MNHCHTHTNNSSSEKIGRAFLIAVLVNLLFTIIEATFALYAHSSSLLADAGHNLGDVLGLLFAWGANYLQRQQPSNRFSYGYKRTSVMAAFFNAVVLISTAVIIAISAVSHLLHPHAVTEMIVILTAFIGIFLNAGTALLFRHGQHDINVKGAFLHLLFDALISLGVVLTAIAIYFTGWYWMDPLISLVIVTTIIGGTWFLFKRSLNLMLDGVPHNLDIEKITKYLSNWPNVKEVHDLHVWGLSTTEIALTSHLVVPSYQMSDEELLSISKGLEEKFGIGHVTIQIERGDMPHEPCAIEDAVL